MDFAPYQDADPEQERARSPPPAGPNHYDRQRSFSRSPPTQQPQSPPPRRNIADPLAASSLPPPSHFGGGGDARGFGSGDDVERGGDGAGVGAGGGGGLGLGGGPGRETVNLFETSLPIRLDYEAMLAYLLLPPAGGVLLLVLEHRSDYVRFHAWQSSLLFSVDFIIHLIFSFSSVISWMLFTIDIVAILFLTFRAYRDADTLDRFEVPFFGGLASSFVDAE